MTRQLTIADLEYELPQERIATHPVSPRSSAKLLVVHSDSFEDRYVFDLPELLPNGALLVVNETSVLPARFKATRKDTSGKVEGLFLEETDAGWLVMLKSNGKLRDGICLQLSPEIELVLFKRVDAHWLCACSDNRSASEILQEVGTTPIPPYIVRARCGDTVQDAIDRKQYQTIFADASQCESVAAPTAGLHFDEKLLAELEQEGFERVPVTLHVGAGTFKGIETDEIADHQMHFEKWSVSQSSLDSIKRAKEEGRPIIAVGTTSVRTLESLPPMAEWPDEDGLRGSTDLMIVPPYAFSLVDGLVTNFHLPKSTLLTLVAAKVGIDKLHQVYEHAISFDYRFYSFGDAMFILP